MDERPPGGERPPGRERPRPARRIGRVLVRLSLACLLGACAGAAGLAGLIWWRGNLDEGDTPADAVVVLGAAQHDGRPSGVFAARLDHAVELFRRGAAPRLIVTGGRNAPDGPSEADVARAYALRRGVPGAAILSEAGSRNTYESLRNVASIMQEHGLRRAVLVSDRAHMLRALLIARRLGLAAAGSPTRTSPADRHPAARLRATLHEIGALARWAGREAGI